MIGTKLIGFLMCFLLLSCKKDLIPIITQPAYNDLEYGWIEEQDDTTFQQVGLGNLSPLGMQFRYPQFNPSNPDELVFVKQDMQQNVHQLVKYNLKTKKQQVLLDGVYIGNELSWSTTGWIAFISRPSVDLYMIKDDGSQLTLLSDISVNLYPAWSPFGNYLYFAQETNVLERMRWVRLNMQTNTLDTLIYGVNDPDFMGFNTKINASNIALSAKDIGNETFYVTVDLDETTIQSQPVFNTTLMENGFGYTDRMSWAHDGNFFFLSYANTGRIFRVNRASGEITLIRDRYHGTYTETVDASPDGKYLAVQRVELSNRFNPDGGINYAGFFTKSKIQLTDLATGKIKILDL